MNELMRKLLVYAETIYGTFLGSKEQSVPSILQSSVCTG